MPVCIYKCVHSTIVWKPHSVMKHTMSLVCMKWHATRTLKKMAILRWIMAVLVGKNVDF